MTKSMSIALCTFGLLLACDPSNDEPPQARALSDIALPQAGKADGHSAVADRQCDVVLREAGLLGGGTPVRTVVFEGASHFVFGAAVDVGLDAVAAGAQVGLAGRPVLSMAAINGAAAGFQRFELEFLGPATGLTATGLALVSMEIIPFIEYPDLSRAYDHNRNPGDFDNYPLVRDNNWKVGSNPLACPGQGAATPAFEEVLRCDGGAAVIDVDTAERRDLQVVVRDPAIVAALRSATQLSYGATHFTTNPDELVIRGTTSEGVFGRGAFSWFDSNSSFESLDIWADNNAPAARVYVDGSGALHVVVLNNDGNAGQPRCDVGPFVSDCVVADWVFFGCG